MLAPVGDITSFMCTEPQCGFVQCSVIESSAGREAAVCPLFAHGINQVLAEKIVIVFLLVGSSGAMSRVRFPSAAVSVPLALQVPLKDVQESSKISKEASVSTVLEF